MGQLLSTVQAAEALGLSLGRVQQFIWSGRLPAMLVGKNYVLREEDVRAFKRRPRKVGRPRKDEARRTRKEAA
jgi:excisionase family DNA binding protein